MARGHARIKTAIWKDEHFLERSPEAQRVYFLLLSQPGLSFCGVIAYTARRWASLAKGTSTKTVTRAVDELAEAEYLMVDAEHEEIWVRSFVKHDGVLAGGPKLHSAMWKDFGAIASPMIRTRFLESLPADIRQGAPDGASDTPSDGASDDGSEDLFDGDDDDSGIPHRMPRGSARPLPPTPTTDHQLQPLASADADRQEAPPADPLWDAMLAACGVEGPPTNSARGAYNRARKDLAGVGATPEEIHRRADILRGRWPDAGLTPSSLARHWAEAAHPPARVANGTGRVSASQDAITRVFAQLPPELNR